MFRFTTVTGFLCYYKLSKIPFLNIFQGKNDSVLLFFTRVEMISNQGVVLVCEVTPDTCLCEAIPDLRLNFQFGCWRWQCSYFSLHVQEVHRLFSKLKLLSLKNIQLYWQMIFVSYLTAARSNFPEITCRKKLHVKRKRRRAC